MCIWTFLFNHLFESLDSRIFIAGLPTLHDKIRTISSVANWTRHDFMDNMEKEGITMLYVYDILLNFTDVHTYLNFFEWENKKELTHVKKIPLLKIPNYQLKEIYENRIQLQDAIWAKLQGKAKASGKKNLTTFLLTDGMKVFAVAFNSKSVLEMRSELLADDEDDIVQLGDDLPFTKLEYRILSKTYQKRRAPPAAPHLIWDQDASGRHARRHRLYAPLTQTLSTPNGWGESESALSPTVRMRSHVT